MKKLFRRLFGAKTAHGFTIEDVTNLNIDPVCQCGCGKTLSELSPPSH